MNKKTVVIHSGGMDSSICLAAAIREFGNEVVLSLSFDYGQRHSPELKAAQKICKDWNVEHTVVMIDCMKQLTEDALTHSEIPIEHKEGQAPNTLVLGRNGLMARLGAIHAHSLGAGSIYMGVIEVEEANCGYRDCSRRYMDMMEEILRIDLDNSGFEIRTPLVKMTKEETIVLAFELGILDYLILNTITCYHGIPLWGCGVCPSCKLRNEGILKFQTKSDWELPNVLGELSREGSLT